MCDPGAKLCSLQVPAYALKNVSVTQSCLLILIFQDRSPADVAATTRSILPATAHAEQIAEKRRRVRLRRQRVQLALPF